MTGEPVTFSAWWKSRRNPFWNATETVKHSTVDLAHAAFLAGIRFAVDKRAHDRAHRDDFSFDDSHIGEETISQ